jgi:hypothetical protein
MTKNNKEAKKENKNPITSTVLDTAKMATPIIKGVSKPLGGIIDSTLKTKDHTDKPTLNKTALAADIMVGSAPIIGIFFPNLPLAFVVSGRVLKMISSDKPITTDVNTALQLLNTAAPIIGKIKKDPSLGTYIESAVKFGKLYNNSKLTFVNEDLSSDLADAYAGIIKMDYKKTAIAMEVLVIASKNETATKAIDLLISKVSNFIKSFNENKQSEVDTKENEWVVKVLKTIDVEEVKDNQLVEELFTKEFRKAWKMADNLENDGITLSTIKNILEVGQNYDNNLIAAKSIDKALEVVQKAGSNEVVPKTIAQNDQIVQKGVDYFTFNFAFQPTEEGIMPVLGEI